MRTNPPVPRTPLQPVTPGYPPPAPPVSPALAAGDLAQGKHPCLLPRVGRDGEDPAHACDWTRTTSPTTIAHLRATEIFRATGGFRLLAATLTAPLTSTSATIRALVSLAKKRRSRMKVNSHPKSTPLTSQVDIRLTFGRIGDPRIAPLLASSVPPPPPSARRGQLQSATNVESEWNYEVSESSSLWQQALARGSQRTKKPWGWWTGIQAWIHQERKRGARRMHARCLSTRESAEWSQLDTTPRSITCPSLFLRPGCERTDPGPSLNDSHARSGCSETPVRDRSARSVPGRSRLTTVRQQTRGPSTNKP